MAALLISRALTGSTGKVEIEGRRYTLSCIQFFRLIDDTTGKIYECSDTSHLVRVAAGLRSRPLMDREKARQVRAVREMSSIDSQLSSRSSHELLNPGGLPAPHPPHSAPGCRGRSAGAAAHGGAFAVPTPPPLTRNTPPRSRRKT